MKRIALDRRLTRQMSVGMKRYALELADRLPRVAPEFEFVTFEHGKNFGFSEQVALPRAMRKARVDLAHFLSLYAPALAPRPYVVTIHDLIHLRFPEFFKAKVGPYYRTAVKFMARRAVRVITDDERTVHDLVQFLHVDRSRVRVIPLGVEDHFLRAVVPREASRPYFLYVGNHRAHKDLPTLFEAWAGLPERHSFDLYLTGHNDLQISLYKWQRPSRRIVFVGDVEAVELPSLYAGAHALVHPSLREGFGLPLLEAMASRTAVVACEDAAPGILEGAMLTFAAGDVTALRTRMEWLIEDEGLRGALVNEGRTRAQALTWDRCARATADVYREVLEAPA
ncbi:MAG: glycosyltransferase family 4 protein [Candidatus Eremiobacteraeota bacterium]|nr:glycosyltransferase family 4 protein [Candidatus Eremiobacteraeota bacterium]